MNAITDEINERIGSLEGAVKSVETGLLDAFDQYTSLKIELWWAEQGEKLDNAKQNVLDSLQAAKDWTVQEWQQISASVSNWFDEKKQQMAQAWGEFKEYAGQKFENFKEAMQQFGEKMAEMWGKAMESLGKMWDGIKIGAHDFAVNAKTAMQNLCTEMYYGAANLGVAVQKGVLAMDDAFQSAKGTVSQAISDKFQANAGKLIVEANELTQKMERIDSMDLSAFGGDDKSMREAQAYKDEMVAKLKQEQAKLTEKIQSREGWRDTFKCMKDKADFKKDVYNVNRKAALNKESHLNTRNKNAVKGDRLDKAKAQKSSYADKVREARTSANQSRGGRI